MKVSYKGYTAEEWHDRYQEAREANRALLEQLDSANLQVGELREAWLALVAKANIAGQAPVEFLRLSDLFKGTVEKRPDEPPKITL